VLPLLSPVPISELGCSPRLRASAVCFAFPITRDVGDHGDRRALRAPSPSHSIRILKGLHDASQIGVGLTITRVAQPPSAVAFSLILFRSVSSVLISGEVFYPTRLFLLFIANKGT
jgi:hypothetical protein